METLREQWDLLEENARCEVTVSGNSQSHRTSEWGMWKHPVEGSGHRTGLNRRVVSNWSEVGTDPGQAVGSGDPAAGTGRPGSPGQAVLVVHSGHDAAIQVLARSGAGTEGPTRCSRVHSIAPGPGPQQQQQTGHHCPLRLWRQNGDA